MNKPSSIALICLLPAAIMLAITYFLYQGQMHFINNSKTADGVVINNASHLSDDDDGSYVYAPVVSFKIEDGTAWRFESNNQSRPASYQPGDKVEVLYDPANPTNAQINTPFELWLACWIVGGIGAIFLIVGLVILFLPQKTETPAFT